MQELVEELGIYMLFFDRAGYGDSDANPKRSLKSDATDVEELADALQLGDKFYVVGCSMGGYPAWSCLNYIPHRSVKDSSLHTTISVQVIDQLVCSEWVARSLQAGRSGSGRAGGELLVAAACQRVEDRVREARRPGP
jgi:pimeloyl-ACP methyl ester carboxylesterase